MRKSVGIDLDGWHDFACRDWSADDPDEPPGEPRTFDGGIGSVVVTHKDESSDGNNGETQEVTVGGPQAILSPIGRGPGWGGIGAHEKRRALDSVWRDLIAGGAGQDHGAALRAAVDALSVQAETVMLCVPDRSGMDEARQHQVLAALAGAHRPAVTLLWRPVALLLDLLDGKCLAGAREGMRIGCLIHARDGWEVQRLTLRRLTEHPGWMAPERGGPGSTHWPEAGLDRLLHHAEATVQEANPRLQDWRTDKPRLALDLLLAEDAPEDEIVRRDNATWLRLCSPPGFRLPEPDGAGLPDFTDCDCVVVLSPLSTRHRDWIRRCLGGLIAGSQLADPAAAARGALRAARRIERNIPHYLDRLDQIALAVLRQGEPGFHGLIPVDAVVPGNREYLSEPITSLVWTEDMTTARFYIRKGDREIRRWVTPEVTPPARNERLEVRLRQMPAQGWAKLLITAPEWEALRRDPIRLDWTTLEVDTRSEEEILDELKGPRPVVPQRVHHCADIDMWNGRRVTPGLASVLWDLDVARSGDLELLADTLARSYRIAPGRLVFPVGTDGELPLGLDSKTRDHFESVMARITSRLLEDLKAGRAFFDNHALRCLTWIFARCPAEVREALLNALERRDSIAGHPLLRPAGASVVVIHGIGRVVTNEQYLLKLT